MPRIDISDRHSIRGLTAPDKQRTNECNELSESFRGLISAGRLLRGRQVSEKVNSPRRGEERFPWGTVGFEAQRTCIGWNKVDLATNAGGDRFRTEGFEAQRTCIGWNKVDLAEPLLLTVLFHLMSLVNRP